MNKKIVFITGGASSGKSSFAMAEASRIIGKKAYIATAQALDEEMKTRIERHKIERGTDWDTYEEPLKISEIIKEIDGKYQIIVVDCLTLWLSNILHRTPRPRSAKRGGQNTEHPGLAPRSGAGRQQTPEKSIQQLIDALKQFKDSSVCSLGSGFCSLYIVSNEVGMGIVPENELARRFRDIAGHLNQRVANIADEVYMVTAGIPMKIKSST